MFTCELCLYNFKNQSYCTLSLSEDTWLKPFLETITGFFTNYSKLNLDKLLICNTCNRSLHVWHHMLLQVSDTNAKINDFQKHRQSLGVPQGNTLELLDVFTFFHESFPVKGNIHRNVCRMCFELISQPEPKHISSIIAHAEVTQLFLSQEEFNSTRSFSVCEKCNETLKEITQFQQYCNAVRKVKKETDSIKKEFVLKSEWNENANFIDCRDIQIEQQNIKSEYNIEVPPPPCESITSRETVRSGMKLENDPHEEITEKLEASSIPNCNIICCDHKENNDFKKDLSNNDDTNIRSLSTEMSIERNNRYEYIKHESDLKFDIINNEIILGDELQDTVLQDNKIILLDSNCNINPDQKIIEKEIETIGNNFAKMNTMTHKENLKSKKNMVEIVKRDITKNIRKRKTVRVIRNRERKNMSKNVTKKNLDSSPGSFIPSISKTSQVKEKKNVKEPYVNMLKNNALLDMKITKKTKENYLFDDNKKLDIIIFGLNETDESVCLKEYKEGFSEVEDDFAANLCGDSEVVSKNTSLNANEADAKSNRYIVYLSNINKKSKLKPRSPISESNEQSDSFLCFQCQYSTKSKKNLRMHFWRNHKRIKHILQCNNCDFVTKSRDYLIKHLRVSHSKVNEYFKCHQCPYTSAHKERVTRHITVMHDETVKRLKCPMCKYNSKRKDQMKQHIKTVHSLITKKFKCTECKFETKWKNQLILHVKFRHDTKFIEDAAFQCVLCKYQTHNKEEIETHTKEIHKFSDVKRYRCIYCEFETKYQGSLELHYRLIHDIGAEIYECYHCGHKTKNKYSLHIHMQRKMVRSNVPLKCIMCPFESHYSHAIQNHLQRTHKVYSCSKCSYETFHEEELVSHNKTHEKLVPYECIICKYCVTTASLLKRHVMLQHERQFTCDKCSYVTKRKDVLHEHIMRKHHVGGMFKCDQCDYQNKFRGNLSKHKARMHTTEMIQCLLCSYKTKRKDSLIRHRRFKHKDCY